MPASFPPPSQPPSASSKEDDSDGSSLIGRFGTATFTAAAAALVASAPATLRVTPYATTGTTTTWIALAGAAAPAVLLLVLLLRKARVGIRSFAGNGGDARLLAVVVWLSLMFLGMVVVGATLRATTHHHGLAGVTFAVAMLVYGSVLVPFATRLAEVAERWNTAVRHVLVALASAFSLASLCFWIAQIAHDPGSPPVGAELVDGLALFIASGFAARRELANHRVLSLVGPPFVLAIIGCGFSILRANPPLMELAHLRAPLVTCISGFCSR